MLASSSRCKKKELILPFILLAITNTVFPIVVSTTSDCDLKLFL